MKAYLVGGAVRDQLLGLPVQERDWVVVGSTPQAMLAQGFIPVGKDFPVFLHPQTKEEHALARTERKTGKGYKGFAFHAAKDVNLEQDLQRRDLTINAIAQADDSTIIDPYGGQADLKAKILRHVSPAFAEDPVRILRCARLHARFYHLGFRIAIETMGLMRHMVLGGEVNALVPERVWQELVKALKEPSPQVFFTDLRECGALKILLPELDALYGVPNPPKHHPEIDTGVHSLLVLQQAALLSPQVDVRFAALLHDLGKAVTPKAEWPKHHGHEACSMSLVKKLCERLRAPKAIRDLACLVAELHGQCHDALNLSPKALLKLLERLDCLRKPDRFQQFLLACEADARGRPGFETCAYPQRQFLTDAAEQLQKVDVQVLLTQGLQGKQLAQAIHKQRLQLIRKFKEVNLNKR